MASDNHLVLLAGLCKKLKLTPAQAEKLINDDSAKFWNEIVKIKNNKKTK